MNVRVEANIRLMGRTLLFARLAWSLMAIVIVGLFAVGIPFRLGQLLTVSANANRVVGELRPADVLALAEVGLSVTFYATYITALEGLVTLAFIGVAVTIAWRNFYRPEARFIALTLLMTPVLLPILSALVSRQPVWDLPVQLLRVFATACLMALFYIFPDGRFEPHWTRWLAGLWIAYMVAGLFFPDMRILNAFGRGIRPADVPTLIWGLSWAVIGMSAQLYRYRRVSNMVQRQQTKWAVFGFASFLAGVTLGIALLGTASEVSNGPGPGQLLISVTLILVAVLTIPASIAFSILRYRLFDIDLIIRRTLQYSLLSGLLALVYFGLIIILQGLFTTVSSSFGFAQDSPLITVLSTLAIAALFLPLRRRVQDFIDKRFYRRKYDAAKVIADFAATARDETDLDALTARLVEVVDETMQPESVGLWLKPDNSRPKKDG